MAKFNYWSLFDIRPNERKVKKRRLTNINLVNLKGHFSNLNGVDLSDVDFDVVKCYLDENYKSKESLYALIKHLIEVLNEIGNNFDIVRDKEPKPEEQITRIELIEID